MTDSVAFFVEGIPVPQGSKNAYVRGGRAVVVDVNKPALTEWRDKVALAADRGVTFDVPVRVTLTFWMPKPKRPRFEVPAVKPDIDKLTRAVFDGLTDGGLVADDARITSMTVIEEYAKPDIGPGVYITVTERTPTENG